MKSGFVAVIGKPNVGKSTLINALVGEKVSITSPKPQTTRNKLLGVKNGPDYQIVFVDTPGVQHGQNQLAKYLTKSTKSATQDVDAIVVLLDAGKITSTDYSLIESQAGSRVPVFVVINKIDITNYEKLYPILAKLNEYKFVKQFVTLSALRKRNLDVLTEALLSVMPEGPAYFDEDTYTDKDMRFMVSEIIREKALLYLQEEIPHGIAVEILTFKELKNITKISAEIICENERHKQIIIGAKGAMLKKIGSSARGEIEKLCNTAVMLELYVKVREGWRQDKNMLSSLGYDISQI